MMKELSFRTDATSPSIACLEGKFSLRFTKGTKDMPLDAKTSYVNPLPFGPDNVMCMIKALLIVAAHSGQTDSDIDVVLGCTYTSPSRIIRWKYGARPLVHKPHVSSNPKKRLDDLEKPLTLCTYNLNVRRLAEQCGILGSISTYRLEPSADTVTSGMEVCETPGSLHGQGCLGLKIRMTDEKEAITTVTHAFVRNPQRSRMTTMFGGLILRAKSALLDFCLPPPQSDTCASGHMLTIMIGLSGCTTVI
ncbi:unnamed protein product [Penicillium salamii]|nr:unnamed protein product [Penicillium salamii]